MNQNASRTATAHGEVGETSTDRCNRKGSGTWRDAGASPQQLRIHRFGLLPYGVGEARPARPDVEAVDKQQARIGLCLRRLRIRENCDDDLALARIGAGRFRRCPAVSVLLVGRFNVSGNEMA